MSLNTLNEVFIKLTLHLYKFNDYRDHYVYHIVVNNQISLVWNNLWNVIKLHAITKKPQLKDNIYIKLIIYLLWLYHLLGGAWPVFRFSDLIHSR
jgi:hypothetical protein